MCVINFIRSFVYHIQIDIDHLTSQDCIATTGYITLRGCSGLCFQN